jgi:hypothetical protein
MVTLSLVWAKADADATSASATIAVPRIPDFLIPCDPIIGSPSLPTGAWRDRAQALERMSDSVAYLAGNLSAQTAQAGE